MTSYRTCLVTALLVTVVHMPFSATYASTQGRAEALFRDAAVDGGYIVHLGCGDGSLTSELYRSDAFFVHGLDVDPSLVVQARRNLLSQDLYGKISVRQFDGLLLPYVDNLINLIVVSKQFSVSDDELQRVLIPGGKIVVLENGQSSSITKRLDKGRDSWPQYLYNAEGTMVSHDTVVGPPRHIQWIGAPKWLRNHEFMSSLHAMVSGEGKVFYILDEGLSQHIYLPAKWMLIARDAYNGKLLWKKAFKDWHPHNWPMKSGPASLPRRLAYQDGKLFVTQGFIAPVSVLDASTGRQVAEYRDTDKTEEILLTGSILYALTSPEKTRLNYTSTITSWPRAKEYANDTFGWTKKSPPRLIVAIDLKTGKTLWKQPAPVAPLSFTAGAGDLFFYDGENAVALDASTGVQKWKTPCPHFKLMPMAGFAFRVVYADGVVLFNLLSNVTAVSAKNGTILWSDTIHKTGHMSPSDLFVIHGKIWTAATGPPQKLGTQIKVIDIKTGVEEESFTAASPEAYFMHQRCHMGRATENYLITAGTGTEFYRIGSNTIDLNHHVRGSCIYGLMPSYGMMIKPPDSCACYYQSKVTNLMGLAPSMDDSASMAAPVSSDQRLVRGPSYGKPPKAEVERESWSTYRGDFSRSGYTGSIVPKRLEPLWETKIGGKLSAAVSVGGRVFVSAIDTHTVHCLDSTSGETRWTFTADGRVDSPPTIYKGMAFFGSADGNLYCVNTETGELAYRYLVAFNHRMHAVYQQLESVWPTHGSVLVRDDVLYCLAGRNMLLDHGMRLVRLEPLTGLLISEHDLGETISESGANLRTTVPFKHMPVANPDILSCDERYIYMGAQKFDFAGKRIDTNTPPFKEYDQLGDGRHLFSPTGWLDEQWFHRSYMIFGKTGGEGHNEYPRPRKFTSTGRMIAMNETDVFSFRTDGVGNTMHPRTGNSLVCEHKNVTVSQPEAIPHDDAVNESSKRANKNKLPQPPAPKVKITQKWMLQSPGLLANSMVLAGDTLILAGPRDVADESKMLGFIPGINDEINRELEAQDAAWRDQAGAKLVLISAKDGTELATHEIDSIPVWDGMAVSEGRLFIPKQNGEISCWGGQGPAVTRPSEPNPGLSSVLTTDASP